MSEVYLAPERGKLLKCFKCCEKTYHKGSCITNDRRRSSLGDTASFTHLLFLRLFSSLAAWLFCSFVAFGSLISFDAFDAEPFDLSFVFAITLNVNGYYFLSMAIKVLF